MFHVVALAQPAKAVHSRLVACGGGHDYQCRVTRFWASESHLQPHSEHVVNHWKHIHKLQWCVWPALICSIVS